MVQYGTAQQNPRSYLSVVSPCRGLEHMDICLKPISYMCLVHGHGPTWGRIKACLPLVKTLCGVATMAS
jgi:hypothetical protein